MKKVARTRPVFKVLGIALIILFIVAGIASNKKTDASAQADASRVAPTVLDAAPAAPGAPVVNIEVNKLAAEYATNEVATDEKYRGSTLHIFGVVQSIDKDAFNSIIIHLATPNEFMPAAMSMTDDQKAAAIALHKGEKVMVECQKVMRLMDSPAGSGCRFI